MTAVVVGLVAEPADALESATAWKASLAPTWGGTTFGLELGPATLPLSVGGEAYSQVLPNGPVVWALWARTTTVIPDAGGAFGAVVGLNGDQNRFSDGEVEVAPLPTGVVLGLCYQRAWGDWWMRLAPHVSLGPDVPTRTSLQPLQASMRSLVAGPSWLEFGYRVAPGIELSLRSSVAPVRVSVLF